MTPASFFHSNQTLYEASAPGIMDVMGGISDYAGGLVLQMQLHEAVTIIVGFREDDWLRIHSENTNGTFTINLAPFRRFRSALDVYPTAKKAIKLQKHGDWAAYITGTIFAFFFENRLPPRGIDVYVGSKVPMGIGVASSSALTVATLRAMQMLYQVTMTGNNLPLVAQKAENYVVGTPCSLAGHLTAHFGQPGQLLPIVCQPDRVFQCLPKIHDLHFIGIDSGARQTLQGAPYEAVRAATFMGYSILSEQEGVNPKLLHTTMISLGRKVLPWNGYVCNITKSEYEDKFAALLPEQITGADFLERYGETIDWPSKIHPEKTYEIRTCMHHQIMENWRTRAFFQMMHSAVPDALAAAEDFRASYLSRMGNWMYASHESYHSCGLGTERTDILVQMAQEAGAAKEVYGAKMTGRGGGGAVCFMAYGSKGKAAVLDIHRRYCERIGEKVHLFLV